MVLKRPYISDTGEDSSMNSHCLGLREAVLHTSFAGDIALSQYDVFSGKIVLKNHSLVTLGKPLLICSGIWGEIASSHSSVTQSFESIQ